MFIWDIQKSLSNYAKHNVSFEEAATTFSDSEALHIDDLKHSELEPRFFRIGKSSQGKILTVVFTIRIQRDGKETIRIISARQASRKERQAYKGL